MPFRITAELKAEQQGHRTSEAAIQKPMKNADPAKHRAGQSIRENTETLPWGYTALAMGKENEGMWFAVLQMKEAEELLL